MKPEAVPIPDRMKHLPVDKRGYPIPVVVAVNNDGEPLFTINDTDKVFENVKIGGCSICGDPINQGEMCFVGGPGSAFHPQGCYSDGPNHRECARYAMMVCPYLAAPKYVRRIDAGKMAANSKFSALLDTTVMPERPDIFVLLVSDSYGLDFPFGPGAKYMPYSDTANRRMNDYEVWRHGEEIVDEEEGLTLIRAAMEQLTARQTQEPKIIRVQPGAANIEIEKALEETAARDKIIDR